MITAADRAALKDAIAAGVREGMADVVAELKALRALMDAPATNVVLPYAAPFCEHPEDRRQSFSGMGEPEQFFCGACSQMIGGNANERLSA